MEKRTLIALGLSFLIIVIWGKLMPAPQNKTLAKESVAVVSQPVNSPVAQIPSNTETYVIKQTKTISLGQDLKLIIAADENKGYISEIIPVGYKRKLSFNEVLRPRISGNLLFSNMLDKDGEIVLNYASEKISISQSLKTSNQPYIFDSLIKIYNIGQENLDENIYITLGKIRVNNRSMHDRFFEGSVFGVENIARFGILGKQPVFGEQLKALGLKEQYFCLIAKPEFEGAGFRLNKISGQEASLELLLPRIVLSPGGFKEFKVQYYFGPQSATYLKPMGYNIEQIINFGFFDPIAKGILYVLRGLHFVTKNWGVAIILLSIVLFSLTYPLTRKQMESMKKMQALQPEMEKIRVACKDNPQKLNKETMELYKKYNVNPISGCLPMLLQIPIFFALYQALMRSIELYGAKFLWIKDLSEPDKTFHIYGQDINLLPIIMAVLMFFQQKTSQQGASGAMAEQQKMMLWIMPVMFGFIFYSFPSGLALYWLFNSLFSFLIQWKTLRK